MAKGLKAYQLPCPVRRQHRHAGRAPWVRVPAPRCGPRLRARDLPADEHHRTALLRSRSLCGAQRRGGCELAMPRIDLAIAGKKFWRLTAIAPVSSAHRGDRVTVWTCRCDCGNAVEVGRNHLLSGNTRSCGCLRKETAARTGRRNKVIP